MEHTSKNIEEVINEFRRLPTDELIAEAILRTSNEPDDLRLKKAGIASFGLSRGGLYIDAARSLLNQLLADASEISWRKEAYDSLTPIFELAYILDARLKPYLKEELPSLVQLKIGANYLSKDSELIWHLYSVCLNRSGYFLRNAARWLDPDFDFLPGEQKYVDLIREFRNHLEHRDEAVQSLSGDDWESLVSMEQGSIVVGYRKTSKNEIIFYPTKGANKGKRLKMALNREGFEKIESIVQRIHSHIRDQALRNLKNYFETNPEDIPDLDDIGAVSREELNPAFEDAGFEFS